ncbi:MAG: RNA polymerase sigma factor [bacterium]
MHDFEITIKDDLAQEQIWIKAAQNDPAAFEPLFNKYHDMIFNYALRRTGNVLLSQDIAATTFMKALDQIKKFQWQGISISSWLYRIAINEIHLHFRKNHRMVPLTSEIAHKLKDDRQTDARMLEIEESILQNEQFQRVCRAIAKLKLNYQTILTLRYFEEKSIKEIADILNLSQNTVKTQIRRGLIYLKRIL